MRAGGGVSVISVGDDGVVVAVFSWWWRWWF